MIDTKLKIEGYLDENHIKYQGIEHAPAAGAEEYMRTLNTRLEQQAKVLLVTYNKESSKGHLAKGYAVVAIQGQKKADLEGLKEIIGASKLRLADRNQLKEITGCNFGELHPFARLFGLSLLMDKDLLQEERIYINAGRLDYSIVLDPKDLAKLENPILFGG
jgi:Ala-tRNA(Pro) deacylase